MTLSPNLFVATQLYLPASASDTSYISKITKPSQKVWWYFDDGRIGIPFFSQEMLQSNDRTEQVNFTDSEFSVIVRSLMGVAKMGRSSEWFES